MEAKGLQYDILKTPNVIVPEQPGLHDRELLNHRYEEGLR
jgi:hypothetical protein